MRWARTAAMRVREAADVDVVERARGAPDADERGHVADGVAARGRALERARVADVAVDGASRQAAAASPCAKRRRDRGRGRRARSTTARPRYPVPPVTSTFIARASTPAGRRASARAESPASTRVRARIAAGIAEEQRHVVRAIARRIDAHGDRHARAREQQVEQIANRDRAARADVVGAAGLRRVRGSAGTRAPCRGRR